MLELRPKIVKYLAGELVARRMKPGMLVLLYLVSWELGNLFPLLSGVISPVRIEVVLRLVALLSKEQISFSLAAEKRFSAVGNTFVHAKWNENDGNCEFSSRVTKTELGVK